MFNKATGEKKLLALINATVSHEMRNPINSINSQLIL
jgi:signal transduction histidine kinase